MQDKEKPVILIVDDVEINVELLSEMIEQMGFAARGATNVREAFGVISREQPQLILLDIVMPEVDGYQMCEMLKENPRTRQIPIIFVSVANDITDKQKAYELGAVDFIHKPFEYSEILMRVNIHLKMNKMQQQLEESNRRLNKVISEQALRLEEEQRRFFRAIAKISGNNQYTGDGHHNEHVAANARLLAQALNFTEQYDNQVSNAFVEAIEMAASVHDIGKLTVPQYILGKKGKLTPEEKEIVYTHTVNGEKILRTAYPEDNGNQFIQMAFDVVRCHHENWDGSGHPNGLKGEEIPLAARIIRIVDRFDCLLGERCYKKAMPREQALEEMRAGRGTRFDPYLLDVFFRIEKQMKPE